MRLHQKLTSLLAASLALVLWGCNSEQVENTAEKTAKGLERRGRRRRVRRQEAGREDRACRRGNQGRGSSESDWLRHRDGRRESFTTQQQRRATR